MLDVEATKRKRSWWLCRCDPKPACAAFDSWMSQLRSSTTPAGKLRSLGFGAQDDEPARHWARDAFNVSEIQIHEHFDTYDVDGSGCLDFGEMTALLTEIQGGTPPTQEEVSWLIKVADRDRSGTISREELLIAVQAWYGYTCLPESFSKMFHEFDKDGDSHLDVEELQNFLAGATRHPVSYREAHDVMEVAAILSDGKIGKYELHGALGAWYVSVGRSPTPAMSLAFIANNRTGGKMHAIIDWAMVAMCAPCGYLALASAYGAGNDCKVDLHDILKADGFLWLAFSVVMMMKGQWVQLMNMFMGAERACRAVPLMSWLSLGLEAAVCTMLTVVEGIGFYSVTREMTYGKSEIEACEADAHMPVDMFKSMKEMRLQPYESFLHFCTMWFRINLIFNGPTILAYYAYIGWRFRRVLKIDQELQEEGGSQE